MILDTQELFSQNQELTATAASTNVLDFGAPGTIPVVNKAIYRDLGIGDDVTLLIQLDADATGTSPTLQVQFQQSPDNATWTTIAESVVKAGGKQGDIIEIDDLPRGFTDRYARLNYVLGGTSPSYTMTAGITTAVPGGRA